MKLITLIVFLINSCLFSQINKNNIYKIDTEYSTINTKNHIKSKGIDLSIRYPKDWIIKEGFRPNVLYSINDSITNSTIMIQITENKDLKDLIKTKEDLAELNKLLTPNNSDCVKQIKEISPNTKKEKCENVKVEGLSTTIMYFQNKQNTLGINLEPYYINYQIFYDYKIININFVFNSINTDEKLAEIFSKKVMSTFVLNNLWI